MFNHSLVVEFIILGLRDLSGPPNLWFIAFFLIYLITLIGNAIVITIVCVDLRLHTPMYFLLSNLSFLEMGYISVTVPKTLVNFLAESRVITFTECVLQVYFFITFASTECALLAVMAYDRSVAICQPLHYTSIMSRHICVQLATGSWLSGLLHSVLHTTFTFQLPFCRANNIDQFFCELPSLFKLSCQDTFLNELILFTVAVVYGMSSLVFILLSYIRILTTILRIPSGSGRQKAFSTCASHLTVVGLFYGATSFMYLRPSSSYALKKDRMTAVIYTALTPMLNPLIYGLRNKDVKEALIRASSRRAPQLIKGYHLTGGQPLTIK